MLFNSLPFIFAFLPISLVLFYLAARVFGNKGALWVLLGGSLLFYVQYHFDDLYLISFSIVFNFVMGNLVGLLLDRDRRNLAWIILCLGVGGDLLILGWFKYIDFLIGSLSSLTGLDIGPLNIALPLGISFFTFTQITFLVDVWRGKTKDRNPARYALFVTLYPHLIAGPILHHDQMKPQFERKSFGQFSMDHMIPGLCLFIIGLAKKVLLADPVGSYDEAGFAAAAAGLDITIWEAWASALAYSLQIYLDFSAYSDMAIGLGMMYGIRLPINFNAPYKATSIIDFWRRWHISLSSFLRDYLYIPLGGNRNGLSRHFTNIFLTMLLGGLWHGANWTFVLWGAMHGGFIVINHFMRRLLPPLPDTAIMRGLAWSITMILVVLAWVPFRADDISSAVTMLRAMAGIDSFVLPGQVAALLGTNGGSPFGNALLVQGQFWLFDLFGFHDTTLSALVAIPLLILFCRFMPTSQTLTGYTEDPDMVPQLSQLLTRFPVLTGLAGAILFWAAVFSLNRPTAFLYFNF